MVSGNENSPLLYHLVLYTCICVGVYVRMYICMYACRHVCMSVCLYACAPSPHTPTVVWEWCHTARSPFATCRTHAAGHGNVLSPVGSPADRSRLPAQGAAYQDGCRWRAAARQRQHRTPRTRWVGAHRTPPQACHCIPRHAVGMAWHAMA